MLVFLFGGPTFLIKMLPVSQLYADFLYEQTNLLINQIKQSSGNIVVIICENNHVNQAFYKKLVAYHPGEQ